MISLYQFRNSLLALVRIMIKNPGMYIDVIYKGRLYRFYLEDLNQDVKQKRKPRKRSLVDQIETDRCPQCKKLEVNGLCMNSVCARNLERSDKGRALPKL